MQIVLSNLCIVFLASLLFISPANGDGTAAPATRVRYDVRSPDGKRMLKIYAKAVRAMQALPDADPRSWTFQWYTHSCKGPDDSHPQNKMNALATIFPTPSAGRDLAQAMWNTCLPHEDDAYDYYFLPWHRAYVLQFEAIVGKMGGDTTFTLPYWDYTNVDPAIHGVLPPEFLNPRDPDFGALYDETRGNLAKQGLPIQQNDFPDPLNLNDVSQHGQYESISLGDQGFCNSLDFGLHGAVHTLVGTANGMAAVSNAARDPIFWMHHCNIDRLWASWNQANGKDPKLDSFSFVFVDGDGKQIQISASAMMQPNALPYKYDRSEPIAPFPQAQLAVNQGAEGKLPEKPQERPAVGGQAQTTIALAEQARTDLSRGKAVVTLQLPVGAAPPPGGHVGEFVASQATAKHVYLVIQNVRAAGHPGTLYHVYLDLPDDASKEQLEQHHVGTINFFSAVTPRKGQGHGAGTGGPSYSFDITKLIKNLSDHQALSRKPVVTIKATTEPEKNSAPSVGRIQIISQ